MRANYQVTTAVAVSILAMAFAAPAMAQQSRGGGSESPGGGEFEGPVPGVQINCTAAYCDTPVVVYKRSVDCDFYLTRAHGPAAKYWEFRYRECKRFSEK